MASRVRKCAYCNKVIRGDYKLYAYYNIEIPLCNNCAEHYFNNTCYKCNKSMSSDFNPYPGKTKSKYLGLCSSCVSEIQGRNEQDAQIKGLESTLITDWALEASRVANDANGLELIFGAGHSMQDVIINIDSMFNLDDSIDDVINKLLDESKIYKPEERDKYKQFIIDYINKAKEAIDTSMTRINQGSSQYGKSYLNQLYLFWLKRTLDLGKQMEIKDAEKYRYNLDKIKKEELDLISFQYTEQSNSNAIYEKMAKRESEEIKEMFNGFKLEGDDLSNTLKHESKNNYPEYCTIVKQIQRDDKDKVSGKSKYTSDIKDNKDEIGAQISEISGLSTIGIAYDSINKNKSSLGNESLARVKDVINVLMDERLVNKSGWSLLSLLDALDHNTYNKCLAAVIRFQGRLSNAKAAIDMVEAGSKFEQDALKASLKDSSTLSNVSETDNITENNELSTDWDLLSQVDDLLANSDLDNQNSGIMNQDKNQNQGVLDSQSVLNVYKQASSLIKQIIEDELILTPFPIIGAVEFKPNRQGIDTDKTDNILKDYGIQVKSTVGTYQIYAVKAIDKVDNKVIIGNDNQ